MPSPPPNRITWVHSLCLAQLIRQTCTRFVVKTDEQQGHQSAINTAVSPVQMLTGRTKKSESLRSVGDSEELRLLNRRRSCFRDILQTFHNSPRACGIALCCRVHPAHGKDFYAEKRTTKRGGCEGDSSSSAKGIEDGIAADRKALDLLHHIWSGDHCIVRANSSPSLRGLT